MSSGSRKTVLKKIEQHIETNGSEIVPSVFIRRMIEFYDEVYFEGQIKDRYGGYPQIKNANHTKYDCEIYVIYDIKDNPATIELVFNMRLWADVKRIQKYKNVLDCYIEQKMFPSDGRYNLYMCMYLVEHMIIDLVMVLWKYHNKKTLHYSIPSDTYSLHGKMYNCILKDYFGYGPDSFNSVTIHTRKADTSEGITNITDGLCSTKLGLAKWSLNSCFFDTLIMAIVYGASNTIRNTILKNDHLNMKYETDKKGNYVNPFPGLQSTSDGLSFRRMGYAIQTAFKDTVNKLFDGNIFPVNTLRRVTSEIDGNINSGEQYEPYRVYCDICLIFRKLMLRKSDTKTIVDGIVKVYKNRHQTPAYPMLDFVKKHPVEEKTVIWDTVDDQILVFYIQNSPWVKRWNSLETEILDVPSYNSENTSTAIKSREPKTATVTIEKEQVFGEYLLNGRYRLFAVIVHTGKTQLSIKENFSGHYTALIRPFFDENSWWYYNDTTPVFEKVSNKGVPPNAFVDTGNMRPHMFFYEKIKRKN